MKKLLNKRIPTILGIILILLSIFSTTFLIENQTNLKSKASDSEKPQNVKVTNISDKSFTITYLTDIPTTGRISYGSDKKLGESELDDSDKEKGSFSPKTIHSMSVKKLIPSTKYYLTIISGSNTFLNNGAPFEITTGRTISSASAKQAVIKGKVVLPDGNAPLEALVYLNAENSQLLSSTIANDGKFSFSLKELRTDDLSSYFNTNESAVFKIFATNGPLKSAVSASLSQEEFIPTITLSNDYNFTQEFSLTASNSAEPALSFPSIIPTRKNLKLEIISPKENQPLTDQRPQFRGTSLPNEKVEIIIRSPEEITTQITADSNGNWTYKPLNNLSPGVHTITIKTRDSSGILTTIIRSFTVFAAETAQTPTPTVPPATPTQKNTPTPTLVPTTRPTVPPISEPSPTITILIPTPTSTFIPLPTVISITSKGGLPPTGIPPILLIVGGITAALTGLALFFFTRKASL